MALGAIAALKASGRQGVIVCGIDAVDDALKAVAAGDQAITMKQDPIEEADATYDLAKQAMSGKMPTEGYTAQFTVITKDNVSQYLH
jgi:inositol transport system substrate-binding protein